MREKLIDFAGLHRVDSGENVSEVDDRINVVALAGGDEREVYGHRSAAGIGADEEKIFPGDHKIFDRPLGRIVVYFKIGIAQKPVQCHPVPEGVFDGFHERVRRVQRTSQLGERPVELLGERLRFPASEGQSVWRWFTFDLPFDVVDLAIYFNHRVAQLEVLSTRVCTTAHFRLSAVLEQGVEAGGSVSLNETGKVFEKIVVTLEREIRRKVEDNCRMLSIASVDGHLTFTHGALCFPVLDFYRAVVRLNDLRSEHYSFESLVEQLKDERTVLEPIAQCRARECGIFAFGDFGLAVLRQAVVTLFHDGGGEQARTGQPSGDWRAGFLSHDDVVLALRAGTHLLLVLKALQAVQDLFQLVRDLVFDKDGFYLAGRAEQVLFRDLVCNRTGREILRVYVLFVVALGGLFARLRTEFLNGFANGRFRTWIMAFCRGSVFFAIPFFLLRKQLVEFGLQLDKERTQFGIAFQGLLQLLLQFSDGAGQFGDGPVQGSDGCLLAPSLFPEPGEFLVA